jgi:hypothetical protein
MKISRTKNTFLSLLPAAAAASARSDLTRHEKLNIESRARK